MINFNATTKLNGAEARLGDLIEFALDNSNAGSIEGLKAKRAIKAKIADGQGELTTEEILIINTSALTSLRDGATIWVIEQIAPNDLK